MRQASGKVILAGAGPGDPDLITLRLQKCLRLADVILADRLVNPAIVELHAGPGVRVLLTGKQGFDRRSIPQARINQLMLEWAREGKTVLRLKGGDVAFFSNLLDELYCLEEEGIPFEIIPGITAASGAAAFAGIPLTARGIASAVQFISFNPAQQYGPDRWRNLAASGDTLVFYMAARSLSSLRECWLQHGGDPSTALAIIEQATTIYQQVSISTMENCLEDFSTKEFSSPALVIAGAVAALYGKYNWYRAGHEKGSVFRDLYTNAI